jgi:hypothetical protein
MRPVTLNEGRAKGVTVIELLTAGGLALDLLPDNGLDIGQVSYKGVNLSWLSKNGYDSPAVWDPHEDEFVHSFPGGLVHTCGLRSVGPANRDGGEWHPLHGRYHGIAASCVAATVEREELTANHANHANGREAAFFVITGTVRETALFGCCLELRRRITVPVWGSSIIIEDTIENLSPKAEEFMLLYHCNFGYPLLSEKAVLELPSPRKTTPRTDFAKTGLGRECVFDAPIDGEEERVFFHDFGSGGTASPAADPTVTLRNESVGIGASLSWSADTLPLFAEWRSMASGDYVLGLEPSNCRIMGRSAERANGSLRTLGAWECLRTKLRLEFSSI